MEVSTDQKGFIVLSDNYHPGWQAEVNGKVVKLFRANYIMRAVPIRAGIHKMLLTFQPKWIIMGIRLTTFGWIALTVLIGISFFQLMWLRKYATN
ncbi:YfhO family protein [Desulfobacterales bacterium HSG16]|nr:YfhO family protein [Desulfobacterales bacterium HSG16]